MHRKLWLFLATAAACALAAPAVASTQSTFIGPNSDSATQNCSGAIGPSSGPGVVHSEASCSSSAVGTASGVAIAAPGHLAVDAQANSHNGDSLVAKIGSSASYDDFITFTSTNPSASTAVVAADIFLDGVMEGAVNGGAFFRVLVSFGGADFDLRDGVNQNGETGFFSSGWQFESGTVGAVTDLHMHTSGVVVPLNSPIHFLMLMELTAAASGPGAVGRADFGVHSFKFAPTPFLLADGVTANAGDAIVNNHFIDPLAAPAGVPEPAGWILMITGFGLAGAGLRRRTQVQSRRQHEGALACA